MYEYIGKTTEKRKKCWWTYGEEEIWKKKMYKKKRLNNVYNFFLEIESDNSSHMIVYNVALFVKHFTYLAQHLLLFNFFVF